MCSLGILKGLRGPPHVVESTSFVSVELSVVGWVRNDLSRFHEALQGLVEDGGGDGRGLLIRDLALTDALFENGGCGGHDWSGNECVVTKTEDPKLSFSFRSTSIYRPRTRKGSMSTVATLLSAPRGLVDGAAVTTMLRLWSSGMSRSNFVPRPMRRVKIERSRSLFTATVSMSASLTKER